MTLVRVLLTISSVAVLWISQSLAALSVGTFVPAYTDATTPYDVDENTAVDHSIVKVVVTDSDGGAVTYAFKSAVDDGGADQSSSFQLDDDVLKTADVFDFEGGIEYFDVVVTAQTTTGGTADLDVPIRVGIADVDEPVTCDPEAYSKDMNDGAPIGSTVVTLSCSDPDASDSAVTYTFALTSGNTNTDFTIGPTTGAITTAKVLDKDTTSNYTVVSTVTSSKSETDTATVNINVLSGAATSAKHLYTVAIIFLLMNIIFSY